jgi:broad specificity phosphatase PhoE
VTKIILTRHGHVDWIAPERFRGRADLPLTEQGLAQARATSARIKSSWAVAAV